MLLDLLHQGGIELAFEDQNLLLRAEDLLLVLFQFVSDVAFRVHECLLAHPLGRNAVLEGIPHLQVVAEDIVVIDLQRRDAGPLDLPLEHLLQVGPAVVEDAPQFVQFGIDAGGDHVALADRGRRLGADDAPDLVQQVRRHLHLPDEVVQRLHALAAAEPADRPGLRQAAPELDDLPRRYLAGRRARDDALEVSDRPDIALERLQRLIVLREILDNIVSPRQFLPVHDRHRQVAAQQTRAHRRGAAVDDIDQRDALAAGRGLEHLQVPEGEFVHPHERSLFDARQ